MPRTIKGIVNYLLSQKYLGSHAPIYPHYEKGTSRILILTGENAEGKSFFARLFQECCERNHIACSRLSMSLRTSGYLTAASLGYRDESAFSTGHSSIDGVVNGLNTCRKNERDHYIIFDEPTIGLSEGYQYAMGEYFADFIRRIPSHTLGVVVATHSRYFVEPLLKYNPNHLRLGDNTNLNDWVTQPPAKKTVDELLRLPDKGTNRFRRIRTLRNTIHR